MNPEELWGNNHGPGKTEYFLKVTLNDAERADSIFSVLMGDEVEPRRIFIEEKMRSNVTNLDA